MICDKDALVCGFSSHAIAARCLDIACKTRLINVLESVGFLLTSGGSKHMPSTDADEELARALQDSLDLQYRASRKEKSPSTRPAVLK